MWHAEAEETCSCVVLHAVSNSRVQRPRQSIAGEATGLCQQRYAIHQVKRRSSAHSAAKSWAACSRCFRAGAVAHPAARPAQCALSRGAGAGVVVGLLALGEGMPSTLHLQALRLASWLCITAGVSALAGGKGAPSHELPDSPSLTPCLHVAR